MLPLTGSIGFPFQKEPYALDPRPQNSFVVYHDVNKLEAFENNAVNVFEALLRGKLR